MAQQSPSPAFNSTALSEPVSLWNRIENADMAGVKEILDAFPHIWQIPVATTAGQVKGDMAIHIAARHGRTDAVGLLLAAGAGLEDRNAITGETPFLASLGGIISTPFILVERGADKNARDKDGRTGLHIAAASGWTMSLRQLARTLNLEMEATDDAGDTPLMSALRAGQAAAAALLLELGAEPDIAAKDGQTPVLLSKALKDAADADSSQAALHETISRAVETSRRNTSMAKAKEVSWHLTHGAGRRVASPGKARFRPQPPQG